MASIDARDFNKARFLLTDDLSRPGVEQALSDFYFPDPGTVRRRTFRSTSDARPPDLHTFHYGSRSVDILVTNVKDLNIPNPKVFDMSIENHDGDP